MTSCVTVPEVSGPHVEADWSNTETAHYLFGCKNLLQHKRDTDVKKLLYLKKFKVQDKDLPECIALRISSGRHCSDHKLLHVSRWDMDQTSKSNSTLHFSSFFSLMFVQVFLISLV